MVVLTQGDFIWVASQCRGEFSIPLGAKILGVKGDEYLIEDDDGKQYSLSVDAEVQLMHPSSIRSVPDMIALGELNECSILRNLFLRYKNNLIYTYTGSILIAINPYHSLPIYTKEIMKEYTNKSIGELPPHLFAIGDNAFRNMRLNSRDQCIIISGESGAGKTESTKLLLQFITTVSGQESCIGQQILDSNPIMEAFGNAKTVRNDNSSRFGKYVDIHFDQNSGHIVSAHIEQYLLEKSRIVRQAPGERNYHAFYCMLAGMPEEDKRRLGLKEAESYNYLVQDNNTLLDSSNDAAHYENIISTMRHLNFTDSQIEETWHLLAAILHLGNISFCDILKESTDASKVKDCHLSELRFASNLLGMGSACLEKALTTRRIQTAGECVVAQFLPANAYAVRDAFVKTIYDHLFCWIVEKINAVIYKPVKGSSLSAASSVPDVRPNSHSPPVFASSHLPTPVEWLSQGRWRAELGTRSNTCATIDALGSNPLGIRSGRDYNFHPNYTAGLGRVSIGVLDIFGFENFSTNSFEQLCINYANENIQQYFVKHIFKLEQEEYLTEGINWTHIKFQDNQEVLDLIAHHPLNILALVDEESRFPRGSDESFLNKLNARHSTTPNYIRSVSTAETRFGIIHFAGPVFYEVEGFLEKNRDTFNHDLLDVISTSNNSFLRELFEKRLSSRESRSRSLTLGMQFKNSLDRLMSLINSRHPFFVRCIKPNEFKLANCFDRNLCVRQLRYSGMMETIQIRSLGYPIRYEFHDFVQRFYMILRLPLGATSPVKQCQPDAVKKLAADICRSAFGINDPNYAIGSTKVFLRTTHDVKLEELREKVINSSAVLIQSQWRGAMARSRYKQLKKSTIFCQRRFRQLAARRRFLRVKFVIIRMQANVRAKQVRKRYVAQKYFILRLQSLARCWLSKQSMYSLMRMKGFFAADMINHCDEYTKVYTCETDLMEDALLRSPMYATWSCTPLPENTAHMTGLATNVPEKCETRQFSVSLESKILHPTKVAHSQAFSDLDSLVDAIFDGVFDSVNPAKRGQSGKNTTAGGSIQIKEDRCLNPTDSVAVNESLDEAMTGELSAVPGTGVGVGSKRFKARCPVLLSPPRSNDGVELTHASAGQHALCAPGSTTGFSEAVSEGEQSMGASTALEDHSTQSECSFFKFAAAYFQTGSSATYTSSRLNRPLFKHRNQHDQSLALDIFSKIMSFMKPKNAADEGKLEPTATTVNEGRSGATDMSGTSTWSPHSSSKRPRVVLSSANGTSHDIPLTDDSDSVAANGQSTFTTTVKIRRDSQAVLLSELCKVRFIVGAGIEHPQMRDEIYCQILKQITKNPCVYSRTRGWILLILCASCFPPTHFDSALKSYLKSNPSTYSKTCLKRLSRIYQTGVRSKPPSYMELKAAEERKSLIVNILCADNGRIKVKVDPTVTVQELSSMAFSAASIKDTFGFEIFINIFDKSYALAMGPNHLFDTISFCEEHAKKNGVRESDLPWSFIIRKTIFAPWHDVTFDPVATSLICYQVTQQCFTEAHETLEEHELAYLMANIYRLLHADMLEVKSSSLSPDRGRLDLHSWLTQILSPGCDISYWQKVMSTALHELHTRSPDATIAATCQNIVTFAKLQWPSIFAREFETIFLQGNCRVQQVLLCVDCYGIQLLSEKRALLNSFPFLEIYNVSVSSATQQPMKVLSVKTIWMKEYRFLSSRTAELMDLLTYMLTGLRQRSRYAIAIKNSPQGECRGKSMIRVNAGDYIILHQLGWELDQKTPLIGYPTPCKSAHFLPQKDTDTSICCYGENQRTWETGYVPITSIYILPSVNPPKPEFIDAFSYQIISSENKHWLNMVDDINSQRSRPPATYFHRRPASQNDAALSHNGFFAVDDLTENCSHRPVSQISDLEAASKTAATYGDSTKPEKQISLKHTRLPLKKPFLREVASADRKISDAALFSFCIIQTYMGDCEKIPPQLKNMPPVFLTDLLFGSALDCPLLRDEVFIQIMNQLTGNPKRTSESKGLELLWLATGIMVPSERVMNRLVCFLHRSPHLLASQCYVRLHHTLSRGMRKKPPHTLEIAAIRGKKAKILQKIILPNEVSLMATLESTTRATDVVRDVVRRFCLASVEHFALYLEVDGELRCIRPEEFVLDALRLTMPEIPQQISLKRHTTFPPPSSLYFMRKLWLNFTPGQDPIEDRQINFPQAMKNFLGGYYQCSPEQALELSTLIFIWHSEEFPNSQISLNKLLPKNMLSNVTEAQWISKLTSVVNANRRLSRNDIPGNFLACLSKVSAFGSSFFHVMPNSSTDTCLMIVNSSSVSLVDDKKGLYEGERCRYSVKDIAECWQDNQIINFQLRKTSSVEKWVSSVTTAYNACDLINCYLRYEKPDSLKS